MPVGLVGLVAWKHAEARAGEAAKEMAEVVLGKVVVAADQVMSANRLALDLKGVTPCSDVALARMRSIDLGSTLLQAVGYTRDNAIVCSSIDRDARIELGEPSIRSNTGVEVWLNVRFEPEGPGYFVIGRGPYVAVVHKDLLLSFVEMQKGTAVAAISWSSRRVVMSKGAFDFAPFAGRAGLDKAFWSGDHVVYLAKNSRYDLAVGAAVPGFLVRQFFSQTLVMLVPIGILIGLLLAAMLISIMRHRTSSAALIRSGLMRDQFFVEYQPVIDLETGQIAGIEALLRWQCDGDREIGPDEFIPVAEESGLIHALTLRLFELIMRDAPRLLVLRPDLHIGINLSANDLHDPNLSERVGHLMAEAGLEPRNFVFEATERAFIDVERAGDAIRALRAMGARIAIDDFGTGYSSLSFLAQLDLDYLKVDKLFVHALGANTATSHVTERVIEIAKDLHLQVIGEGAETEAQVQMLRALGVEYAQGFYFDRALDVSVLEARLAEESPYRFTP
ncbi:EAL domain-containing protein [Novosphingobium sp. BW1]|uniref:EAL domain-containing protein n=1 Tax=Novosphingobium sp. BW1 TaxID=2592621 RepID=UPI0011DEE7BE|nr:EAL domain-containing protein [Novosphingobium sp. BW1]TYC90676.1 EAL domain-containing protein [Novosphingobium sp. BW1]